MLCMSVTEMPGQKAAHQVDCSAYERDLVGKHGAVDDVANGVDAVNVGLEVVVHLDAAALIQLHTHLLQAQPIIVRPPP